MDLRSLPLLFSIERIKPYELMNRSQIWTEELKTFVSQIPSSKKTILFNYEHAIEAMYYSDLIGYRKLPDSTIVNALAQQGYQIYINGDLQQSPYDDSIIFVSLPHSGE